MSIVFLNGEFVSKDQAFVHVNDRGFLFGDAIYEVIPVFNGKVFRIQEHLQRLDSSLKKIYMENPLSDKQWEEMFIELINKNQLFHSSIYLQVTRGVSERDHAIELPKSPTIYAFIKAIPDYQHGDGITAITHEDIRWGQCDIKATTLLPAIILRHKAKELGAKEAILYRENIVTEGAATNVFIVKDKQIYTPTQDNRILPGVTRNLIIELLSDTNTPVIVKDITIDELKAADEVWVCSSTWEIVPIIQVDDTLINNGKPGALWNETLERYQTYKKEYSG